MLINDRFNIYKLLQATGSKFLILLLLLTAVGVSSSTFGFRKFLFPTESVGVFMAAVRIFLAFRINTGYSRWWLARQIWGGLVKEVWEVWGHDTYPGGRTSCFAA